MKKFTKEHRDTIEKAVSRSGNNVVVTWIDGDFCTIKCKKTDEMITCAWVNPLMAHQSSKDAMISMLGDLMRASARFHQTKETA
jgi:hypothetical protein